MKELSFKDWVLYLEASFTTADIPPYFYVGCHFSEDFVKKYPFTPKGAAASLVGLEGISSSESTASSFGSGKVVLKMPGKALVDLNKISRTMYDNPHYMASAGFRTPRRLKAGSDPLHSGSKSYKTEDIVKGVVGSVLSNITSHFPEFASGSSYAIKGAHGEVLNADEITDMLKKLKPMKGVFSGREGPGHRWGTRSKPLRKRHAENHLKSLKSADDLAERLQYIFRAVLGDDALKFLNPSGDMHRGKEIPLLKRWVRQHSLEQGSGYSGEQEWVTKRQPLPGVKGIVCPNCKKYNTANESQIGTEITCWNCSTPIQVNKLETGARPVLHVPDGSIMLVDVNNGFPSWGNKYIQVPSGEYWDDDKKFKALLDNTKIYKKLNIFLQHGHDMKATKSQRPYDPERVQTQEDIKRALMRGTNAKLIEKLMASKGVPAEKVRDTLNRWEAAGVLKKGPDDRLMLVDPDFDEDSIAVYENIKGSENATDSTISKATGVSGDDLKAALKKLMEKKKIQQLNNGTYDITLTDEEMKTISEDEQKVLDALAEPNAAYSDPYYFNITDMDSNEVKSALRNLHRKGKVFKSKFSGYWRQTIPEGTPLTANESKMMDYLKKWPETDLYSIKRVKKNQSATQKALDGLLARGLISIDGSGNITLDKGKTPDHDPNAKGHGKVAETILKIAGSHFVSNYREIANIANQPGKGGTAKKNPFDAYGLDGYVKNMLTKGLLVKQQIPSAYYNRLVPANASYLKPQSIEERIVIKYGEKKDWFSSGQITKVLQKRNTSYYSSTESLLQQMMNEGKLKTSYHPLDEETYYHLASKEMKVDTSKFEKAILEIIEEAKKPVDVSFIESHMYEKAQRSLSETAVQHILDKMLAEPETKIKTEEDFTGTKMYFMKDAAGPAPAESYFDHVKKVLADGGPQSYGTLYPKLETITGLGYHAIEQVLRLMSDQNMVESEYSHLMDDSLYRLPGQKIPEAADYKDQIMKMLEEKPLTSQEIWKKLVDSGVQAKHNPLSYFLREWVDADELKMTKGYDGKYYFHLAHQDPNEHQQKKYEDLIMEYIGKWTKSTPVRVQDVVYWLYNNHYLNYETGFSIVKKMIDKHLLWVKAGDIDDEDEKMQVELSVSEVDPATIVKNPALAKAEPLVMAYMQANGANGEAIGMQKIGAVIKSPLGLDWSKSKKILKQFIADGKLQVVTPMDDYDFWDQEVVLPGAKKPQAVPVPPTGTPPQPLPPSDVLHGNLPEPPTAGTDTTVPW